MTLHRRPALRAVRPEEPERLAGALRGRGARQAVRG